MIVLIAFIYSVVLNFSVEMVYLPSALHKLSFLFSSFMTLYSTILLIFIDYFKFWLTFHLICLNNVYRGFCRYRGSSSRRADIPYTRQPSDRYVSPFLPSLSSPIFPFHFTLSYFIPAHFLVSYSLLSPPHPVSGLGDCAANGFPGTNTSHFHTAHFLSSKFLFQMMSLTNTLIHFILIPLYYHSAHTLVSSHSLLQY